MSVAVWFLCGVIALHRGRMRGSSQGEKGSGGEGVPHHNRRFQLWRTLAGERAALECGGQQSLVEFTERHD